MKRRVSLFLAALSIAVPLALVTSCGPQTLDTTVKAKLAADPGVQAAHIEVTTKNGEVMLTGNVDSQETKDRAIELAKNTTGVTHVVDMISVRTAAEEGNAPEPDRTVGEHIDDAAITLAVKSKLLADPLVKGSKIDVDTRQGVVYLTGKVSSSQEKNKAIDLARETEHVKDVQANLDVQS